MVIAAISLSNVTVYGGAGGYALKQVSPGLLGFGARNSKLAEIC